jgi:hypothetical protein
MHGPINIKAPNNTSKRQMGFNSAFKGLINPNPCVLIPKCKKLKKMPVNL